MPGGFGYEKILAGAFLGKPAKVRQRTRRVGTATTFAGAASGHPYGKEIPRLAKASKHHLYSATNWSTTDSALKFSGSTSQV